MRTEAFAPAKVNLALHVTGRRADGYHQLDSLVVFAACGDRVHAEPAAAITLAVTGPRAASVPVGADNLVLRAACLLAASVTEVVDPGPFDAARMAAMPRGAAILLEKHLPTAAGIGGGSSDAAATLRALARLWGCALPTAAAALTLGADLPVCLFGAPARMQGVGDVLEPVPLLPPVWIVLANPGVAVPTAAVFGALARRDNQPMPPVIPVFGSARRLAQWLAGMRNDLQPCAIGHAPVIATVLAALSAQPGCLLARMSGSGATCFGLFGDPVGALAACRALRRGAPSWWVQDAPLWRAQPVTPTPGAP